VSLEPDVVALLAVVACAAAGVLLLVVIVLFVRLGRLRRAYRAALGEGEPEDLFAAVRTQGDGLAALRDDLALVHRNTEALRDLLRGAVSRVGLVRYDAFPDMGGMLSFSAALLDEQGTGVVISSINGRQETRSYGKPVMSGESEYSLSDEERDAVRAALEQPRPDGMTESGGRRRRSRG